MVTNLLGEEIPTESLDARLERMFAGVPASGVMSRPISFFDRYHVLRELGSGAEGSVFQVEERVDAGIEPKRYIAKVIRKPADSTEIRNLHREIQARSRVHNSHIQEIVDCHFEYDENWKQEKYILLMENAEGETLAQRWQRLGPLKAGDVQSYQEQILTALAAAHSQGVLHRDIKPDNILISPEGNVTLFDWGVAKIEGRETRLSTLGVVGTAGYMAPEIIKGEKATALSDIYSVGATCVAALRGEHIGAFDGPNELKAYMDKFSLPTEFREGLEGMIREKVEKRTWKEEEGRYVIVNNDTPQEHKAEEGAAAELLRIVRQDARIETWGFYAGLGGATLGSLVGTALSARFAPELNLDAVSPICIIVQGGAVGFFAGGLLGFFSAYVRNGVEDVQRYLTKRKQRKIPIPSPLTVVAPSSVNDLSKNEYITGLLPSPPRSSTLEAKLEPLGYMIGVEKISYGEGVDYSTSHLKNITEYKMK